MAAKPRALRPVGPDERRAEPLTVVQAVETGDVLEILLAQRRLIAESLEKAAENTRPQFNNELNKLHALIAAEQARQAEQEGAADGDLPEDEVWDGTAI